MTNIDGHGFFFGKGGIGSTYQIVFEEGRDGNDLGYNIFIKKTDQLITMAEIAGTYQVRFLQTGPGGVPYTCGQGTCVIEAVDDANGILLVDAYYSNGEHSVTSKACSVGPGNEFHLDDDGVPDGIISPDKNLILGVEYLYENPPTRTEDDWIGGTFFIRMPENIGDFNGDGIVDAADTAIMLAHWGEDYPLCDIAPPPSGDGVVDIQDLIALTEQMSEVRPPSETVEVNEDNDGGQIEIEQGRILVVTLESNPSSGYMWELAENNKSILKQLGQAKFQPSETSEPPIPGSGGWESFRFKAIGAGQVTLKLVYHRSWEDVEPLKTFSIQVAVP
jgi:inhibitor of cysteine peptidase